MQSAWSNVTTEISFMDKILCALCAGLKNYKIAACAFHHAANHCLLLSHAGVVLSVGEVFRVQRILIATFLTYPTEMDVVYRGIHFMSICIRGKMELLDTTISNQFVVRQLLRHFKVYIIILVSSRMITIFNSRA